MQPLGLPQSLLLLWLGGKDSFGFLLMRWNLVAIFFLWQFFKLVSLGPICPWVQGPRSLLSLEDFLLLLTALLFLFLTQQAAF